MTFDFPFGVRSWTVFGAKEATETAAHIIAMSQWFMLTPLPDDMWLFTVKLDFRFI